MMPIEEEVLKLINSNKIIIVSGEGELGYPEQYTGKRTLLAIKRRLNKEKAGGYRWAKAIVYSHECKNGEHAGIDIEKLDFVSWGNEW